MIRTQISLNEEEYEAAKAEAERLGIPLAELLRRSLRTLLPEDSARPWMRFAGMIESVRAVENAGDIASVAGFDMLLVGANDLCNSLGVPGQLEHPSLRDAYRHVADVCRAKGKHLGVGGLNSRPDLAKEMIAMGARYVSTGSDTGFLMSAATAAVKTYR